MKLKFVKLIAITVAIFGVTWSCQKETVPSNSNQEDHQNVTVSKTKKTILGRKLQNPYSVENMQKAWQNLKSTSKLLDAESTDISATHLYLKFKPKNEAELDILQQDSTLILYTYPMDYEIRESGDYYHDPEIPTGQPTYQYCAVKVDKPLPNGVAYDVLEELFIPDDNEGENLMSSDAALDSLVEEALRITNNLEPEINRANQKRRRWRPAGTIRLLDDEFGRFVGLQGAKVRARRWFTTHTGYTNASGWFSCDGTFKRSANYSIKWERHDYDIRSGNYGQATYNGPKRTGDWNLDITGGTTRMYAIVHQAAHDYYYGHRLGLKSPPRNSVWKAKIKFGVWDSPNPDANGSHTKNNKFLGINSRLKIWNNGGTVMRIYGTTLHELAHASHWELRRNNWKNGTSTKVKESWARGVQWALGRLRYPDYFGGPTIRPNYTQLVVDLIDPNYLSRARNENNGLWNDNVTGYTIRDIENTLSSTSNWTNWQNNIINTYTNATEANLPNLFNFWN